jgi:2,3-bisphosphoglycerate-dependent phosphoglycerate mutase
MSVHQTVVRQLVLVRHGESVWNQENRFTGWQDVDLSPQGVMEARQAGQLLKTEHFFFDGAFTSLLKRAIRTLWFILESLDQCWLPVEKSWRFNERHYGVLQGLNKVEAVKYYGAEQVQQWRRGFSTPPPALALDDPRFPGNDARYASLLKKDLPTTESLAMTVQRVVPYWSHLIQPKVAQGEKILIVAHGNSLRALVKHLDNLSESAIADFNIPTGIPLLYEFDENMQPRYHCYLGDPTAIGEKIAGVASQTHRMSIREPSVDE